MKLRKILFDRYMRDMTSLASIPFSALLIILFSLLGHWDYALLFFAGNVFVLSIPYIIRLFYFKRRPDKTKYDGILQKIDASSFPSVHSARAFFSAYALSIFFETHIISVFLFLLAGFVSYTRIYLKRHDEIDALCGALLGMLIGAGLIFLFYKGFWY